MASLLQLPPDVVCGLLQALVAADSAGAVLRLAACCRGARALVEGASFFWQQQAQRTGWLRWGAAFWAPAQPRRRNRRNRCCCRRRRRPGHPAFVPSPQQQQQPDHDTAWCRYYSLRMGSRWRLRCARVVGSALAHAAERCRMPVSAAGHLTACSMLLCVCNCCRSTLLRKYMPFLNTPSRLALQPGGCTAGSCCLIADSRHAVLTSR